MRVWIRVVFAVALVASAGIAYADTAAEVPAAQPLIDEIVKAVAALVGLGVLYALNALSGWLKAKGIEMSILEQARREQIAQAAAMAVEEKAADYAKRNAGEVISGEQKLVNAASKVLEKVPGIDEAEARDLVRAALPRLALGAAAALRAARERKVPQAVQPPQE